MIKYQYNCYSEGGKVKIENRADFVRDMHLLEGLNLTITVEQRKNKRSNKQLGYYFGVVIPLIHRSLVDIGWSISDFPDSDSVHIYLKTKFCPPVEIFNKDTGEIITMPPTTKVLTPKEMEDYLESVKRFAAEYLSLIIPDPNQTLNNSNYEI